MIHSKMSNGELKSAVIVTAFSLLLLLVTTFFLCYNYDRLAQQLSASSENSLAKGPSNKRGPKMEPIEPHGEVIEEFYHRRVTKDKDTNEHAKPGRIFDFSQSDFAEDEPNALHPDSSPNVVVVEVSPHSNYLSLEPDEGEFEEDDEEPINFSFPAHEVYNSHPQIVVEPIESRNIVSPSHLNDRNPFDKKDEATPSRNKPESTLLLRLLESASTATPKPPLPKPQPIPKPRMQENQTSPGLAFLSALQESNVQDDDSSDEEMQPESWIQDHIPQSVFGFF